MLLFEAIVPDDSDLIFSPCWRQGLFVWAFCSRLGLSRGALDAGITSHPMLAGLLLLAAAWHWAFWDLEIFTLGTALAVDLLRVFGVHLVLAAAACFPFGSGHLTASVGPGFWTTSPKTHHTQRRHVRFGRLDPRAFGSQPLRTRF
jgi:photosystem II CP47 chlorophyll apoprotein